MELRGQAGLVGRGPSPTVRHGQRMLLGRQALTESHSHLAQPKNGYSQT